MSNVHPVRIGSATVGEAGGPLALVAGPCVIESYESMQQVAGGLADLCRRLGVPYVFKASFDKANRSSIGNFRGPGLDEGLDMLARIREEFDVPVLSDIHEPDQAPAAGRVLDCVQIPALLCRQTDLLVAAGRTGKPVNIKKGQFMAPWDMAGAAGKVADPEGGNNPQILLTERGTTFGYNRLVVDMTSLALMRELGHPVVFDATHAVQMPGGLGTCSGGNRELVPTLARAAVAAGCDALFMEVHTDPEAALCDGPNMVALAEMDALLRRLIAIRAALA